MAGACLRSAEGAEDETDQAVRLDRAGTHRQPSLARRGASLWQVADRMAKTALDRRH